MKTLFLYLRDFTCDETDDAVSYGGTISWLVESDVDVESIEGESHVLELKSALDELEDQTRFNSTVLFLDDSCTLFVREKIPGKTVPQIRRALPFAVENYLSHALEDTHIAHGPISRTSAVDCVAIDSKTLENVLQALRLSSIYPTVCTTLGMQIPRPEGEHDLNVLKDDTNAWIRTSEHLALVNVDALSDVVNTFSGHRDPVPKIQIWNYGTDEAQFFNSEMYESESFDRNDQSLVSYATEHFELGNCLNLLQGKYSAKEHATANLRRWVMTGIIGLVCLYAYIAIQATEGIWASIKVNGLQNQMKAQFVEIYDTQPRNRDIAKEMRSKLGVAGDSTRAFDLLMDRLAEVMSSPSHSPKVNSVKYEAERQKLDVAYTISSHEAMEAFIRALGNNMISVERGPAESSREQSVRASVTLSLRQ